MDQRTRKRDAPDTEDELKEGLEPPGGLENGLQAWGYDPSHYNYNLGTLMSEVTLKNPSTAKSVHSEEMRDALRAFPPRTITDALVQNFIQIQVYHYSPIYAPTFLDSYARWWQEKTSGQALSPEFTCLLLRILACSAQYLAPAIKKKVEYELSESPQVLTESYDRAAKRLSDIIVPGTGGLDQVIQLFLVGSWMKSEGLLVESWHALSDAIRDAQELGMPSCCSTHRTPRHRLG